MKNWKNMFSRKYFGWHSRDLAVSVPPRNIRRGDLRPDQLDAKTDADAEKPGDSIYARCGEVFRFP